MGRYQAQQIQFATVAAALAVQRERVAVKGYVPDCADVAGGLANHDSNGSTAGGGREAGGPGVKRDAPGRGRCQFCGIVGALLSFNARANHFQIWSGNQRKSIDAFGS